jgi:autotransporter family porin
MKIIKILPTHTGQNRRKIILKTSASLVAGVLSFGCADTRAETQLNTSGTIGIGTSGIYVDETIKMNAANTAGIKIGADGTVTLSRGSIKNNAISAAGSKNQIGVYVFDGGHVALSDSAVALDPKTATGATVTANDMTALVAKSGGQLNLDNSTVTVGGGAKGNNNVGIAVTGPHSKASLSKSTVQTSSWGAPAVSATQGGRINLSEGTTILTTGARGSNGGGHGVTVDGLDSALYAENSSITTTGASAYGVKLENSAALNLTETTITTSGANGHGILLDGDATSGTIFGSSIQTTGKGATGLWARNGASVSLQQGTSIKTSGAAVSVASPLDNEKTLSLSHTLLASDHGSDIDAQGVFLTTSAASASAARAENNARINLRASEIVSSGSAGSTTSTAALHALSGATITGSELTVNVTGNYQGGGRAEGEGSSVYLNNSNILVKGGGGAEAASTAARAMSGGSVQVTRSTMTTLGMQSHGVSAEGAGSHAKVSDTTIETYGARSSGVNIINGATADISDSIIKTSAPDNATGPWGPGILLQGVRASLSLTNTDVSTTQKSSVGISATSGSHLEIDTSRITTSGNYGSGIAVANTTATITGTHITTSGDDNAMGVIADAGATVTVVGGSIVTSGNGSTVQSNLTFPHAVASRNPGSLLTIEGTSLLTTGTQAYGAAADDGGNIILKNVSVKTQGDNSFGLYAGIGAAKPGSVSLSASNVTVETLGNNATGALVGRKFKAETAEMALDSVTLTTHGDNSRGIWAEAGADLSAENSVIRTMGADSTGALVNNTATLSLNKTGISTLGELAHGILASNGGSVFAENTIAATQGDGAAALAVQGSETQPGKAIINNTILTSNHGYGIETTGYADIDMQNSRVNGESQWLQVKNGSGALPGNASVEMSGSIVTGAALTEAGAWSEVSLNNTSLWFLTGSSVLSELTNNHSLINFSTPKNNQYKTLTVNNYHGDNATIALNTHLHDDDSPTDRLVINGGKADGSTSLKITNTDGSGALTHGNGIKVVDAISGATTTTEAFSLLSKVKAGPYEYSLYRSSVDDTNKQAWYLRSHKNVSDDIKNDDPPSPPPADPVPDPEPELIPEPKPGEKPVINPPVIPVSPPPVTPVDEQPAPDEEGKPETPQHPEPPQDVEEVPDYRAETSLYQEIPQLALLYSRMLVDSLHERTGEQFASPEKITQATQSPHMSWGRVIYKNGKSDFDGPQSRFTLNAIQLGIDLYRESKDDGSSNFAGVLGNIGKMKSKVTHTDGENAGRNTLKSWGIGSYWTHFTPAGSYLDAVAQYNRLYVESSPTDLSPMKTKGYALSASLEAGYPWQPDAEVQRFIEPQAQLIYSTVKLDNTHDNASRVNFSDADSLTGRVSLRFHQTWNHNDTQKSQEKSTRTTAWLRPGIVHEFRGETKTNFASQDGYIPFATNSAGTWGQLNAGVDHQLNKSVSLTGSLSVEKAFTGNSVNYGGIVGLKIKF